MKKRNKRELMKGITLIALVLTIIILLILAGVSLSLVAGSNGILNRATNAVNSTNLANIKEELELKITQIQLDYYSNSNLQEKSVNEYVKEKLNGIELSNGVEIACDNEGNLSYDGLKIGKLNPDGTIMIDGEFNSGQIVSMYKVSYDPNGGIGDVPEMKKYQRGEIVTVDFSVIPTKKGSNFLGWATDSSATTPEYTASATFEINQNTTLYAVWETSLGTTAIQPQFYGDKVNYNANGVNDWQVFLNDGSNVYLISSDYVENTKLSMTSHVEKVDGSNYKIKGNSRDGLVTWLTNTSNWNNFIDNVNADQAMGGPTKEQFVKSYNDKYNTSYSDGLESSNSYAVSVAEEPYIVTNIKESCGYWMTSICTDVGGAIWRMSSSGEMDKNHYSASYDAVRPLVRLKSTTKMTWNGSSWDFSE